MSLYQIDKLSDSNYDAWSIHMKSVLVHSGYWNIVSGKETADDEEESKRKEKWPERDQKALATITLCINAAQLSHIKSCKTSSEAWNTLKEVFRPSGPVKKVYLYKQLLNKKMSEDGSMSEHLRSFSEIVDKLAEVGIELHEELVTIILLSSLPAQYEQFVVAMETRDILPTIQNLKVKLLEEADRKLQKEGERQQIAFTAKQNSKYERFKKSDNGKRNDHQSRKKSTVCFICGKPGHFAASCYSRKKYERKENVQSQFTVLAAAESNALEGNIWCIDSGATAHMSGDRLSFTTLKEHREKNYTCWR
ncbi:Retrovirus-related Pol polyprotein from transposon TNT 1-94 [Eumeta japonica]|uniref:Retrovirus-related Pol polyprotein from transposon TNT 1-94 n=1 Tax=Eumeta variegata TaxID=151549 RepID=A0A4C1ZLS2_EUMVA|nr:Retrovirus-related Pol polyprotein from transposon TNT 1-94 [Eumeta japonica]